MDPTTDRPRTGNRTGCSRPARIRRLTPAMRGDPYRHQCAKRRPAFAAERLCSFVRGSQPIALQINGLRPP
jgi:hypothetical protein